jgi:cyclomaltodextrinase
MLLEAIYHRPKSNYAYAYNEETLHIRVRTKKNDMDKVHLFYGDKYDLANTSKLKEMNKFAGDSLFDYYQTEIVPLYRRTAYGFLFESSQKSVWYSEKGFQDHKPDHPTGLFEFPFINPVDVMETPDWVKKAVFYQIFPERFANGDPTNDPRNVEPWGGKPKPGNFFGGDLQGVIDHIDHLKELGVNAIYFTPVFEAKTNHKYDTVDYMKVDPHFGDNDLLKKLVQVCHENGIRVMLDAVFNHSGYSFPPFQDVLKHQEKSKYVDWFHLREFPVKTQPKPNYDSFAFTPMMPKLNTENPEVKEYLLDVARYWVEEIGIDGWRLDVANEVDHQFWREFRQVVKKANPEAYILGEIWHNSLPWLLGDQFDAVMNYPVTNTTLDFFCKETIDANQFMSGIDAMHISYPLHVNQVAFNLLDSHDTPRLLTVCNHDKKKLKLAVAFQLTYLGAPCIYYGDEIGLTGGNDPDCRKTMIWDEAEQDRELFNFYKQMIDLRKNYAALRTGTFTFLSAKKRAKQIAYERKDANDHFVILMNAATKPASLQVHVANASWLNILNNQVIDVRDEKLKLKLGALDYVILKKQEE